MSVGRPPEKGRLRICINVKEETNEALKTMVKTGKAKSKGKAVDKIVENKP